jgi:hypothetical protein
VLPLHLDRFTSAALLGGIGIIASYIFFLTCERPFMTMGKKKTVRAIIQQVVVDPAI